MMLKMNKYQGLKIFKKQFMQGNVMFSDKPEPLCYATYKKIPSKFNCHIVPINQWQNKRSQANYKLKCYYKDNILAGDQSIRDFAQNIKNKTNITINLIINNKFLDIKKEHYHTILLDATDDFADNYYDKLGIRAKDKLNDVPLDYYHIPESKKYYNNIIVPVVGSLVFIKDDGSFFAALPLTKNYIMENKFHKQEIEIIKTTVSKIATILKQDIKNKKVSFKYKNELFEYYRDRFVLKNTSFGKYDKSYHEIPQTKIGVIELNYNHSINSSKDADDEFNIENFEDLNTSQAIIMQEYLLKHFNASYDSNGKLAGYIINDKGKINKKISNFKDDFLQPNSNDFGAVCIKGTNNTNAQYNGSFFIREKPNIGNTKIRDFETNKKESKIINPLFKRIRLKKFEITIQRGNNHLFYITKNNLLTVSAELGNYNTFHKLNIKGIEKNGRK